MKVISYKIFQIEIGSQEGLFGYFLLSHVQWFLVMCNSTKSYPFNKFSFYRMCSNRKSGKPMPRNILTKSGITVNRAYLFHKLYLFKMIFNRNIKWGREANSSRVPNLLIQIRKWVDEKTLSWKKWISQTAPKKRYEHTKIFEWFFLANFINI